MWIQPSLARMKLAAKPLRRWLSIRLSLYGRFGSARGTGRFRVESRCQLRQHLQDGFSETGMRSRSLGLGRWRRRRGIAVAGRPEGALRRRGDLHGAVMIYLIRH